MNCQKEAVNLRTSNNLAYKVLKQEISSNFFLVAMEKSSYHLYKFVSLQFIRACYLCMVQGVQNY